MRFIFFALSILLILILVRADVSAGQSKPIVSETNREEAERLWEEAIAAKGGRERLHAINNLQRSVRLRQWWNLRRVPYEIEALYVFPRKSWEWVDQTGTIFGFKISMHNYDQNIHWYYLDHGKGPTVAPFWDSDIYKGAMSAIINVQLNYLMETRWVKPIPVSVERGKVGGHAVDIVRTIVKGYPRGEETVSFALDRKTHLPRQVIYHAILQGKEYSGGVSLSDYTAINGIQMPGKVGRERTVFQFNVDYNERIFEQPPSRAEGIDAWKKK